MKVELSRLHIEQTVKALKVRVDWYDSRALEPPEELWMTYTYFVALLTNVRGATA